MSRKAKITYNLERPEYLLSFVSHMVQIEAMFNLFDYDTLAQELH
jgi:hypothetical protein